MPLQSKNESRIGRTYTQYGTRFCNVGYVKSPLKPAKPGRFRQSEPSKFLDKHPLSRQISMIGLHDIDQRMWNVVPRRKPQVEWRVYRCRSVVPAPHGIFSGGSSPIKYNVPTSGWSVTVLVCKTAVSGSI
ncbi:uncharacterized protein CLUP02_14281 [Colletotrichum lupini]|uniref:Uncharacterized protein n=1 Tax=Colletotrichum lupini TaxID=145971 RepID=A0A9Q8T3Y3_9PEZI|nr:uncharacterized protein CLUP02_14281 [Colletotrichum lupini]UQC88756.1 hypothetical protein CLUP02_14281 [Colletotrichum lupini]